MSTSRISPTLFAVVAIALSLVIAVASADPPKARKNEQPQPATTKETEKREQKQPDKAPPATTFVPSEKVSAGKPVSFPSDI